MGSTEPEAEVEVNNLNGHLMQDLTHQNSIVDYDVNDDVTEITPWCSQRWIIGYLGLVVGTLKNILQVNISIVIVCMVGSNVNNVVTNTKSSVTSNVTSNVTSTVTPGSGYPYVPYNNVSADMYHVNTALLNASQDATINDIANVNSTANDSGQTMYGHKKTDGEFDWDASTQSVVLSAFFYGYMCTLILCGWLASKYGGKHVLIVTFFISSAATLFTPVLARTHVYLVVAVRVVIGMCLAGCSPGWMAVIGVWSLPTERTRLVSLYWIGQVVGTVLGLTSSGYLCAEGFDNGWASVFYIHGGFGLLVVFALQWLVYSNPDDHPRISEAERRLLAKTLRGSSDSKKHKKLDIPWCKILMTLPVWAVFIAHFSNNWTFYLLLTCLPKFLNDVLNFDIESNGILSALPFITLGVSFSITGLISDGVAARKWMTMTTNRKVFQFIGLVGAGVLILTCGYVSQDQRAVVIFCLCVAMFFNALGQSGYSANIIDIAPRHSALIYSTSNTFSCISGVVSPVMVATLTENKTIVEWRYVFYLTAGIALAATIVYMIFASSELAPWAREQGQEIEVNIEAGPVEPVEEEGEGSSLVHGTNKENEQRV